MQGEQGRPVMKGNLPLGGDAKRLEPKKDENGGKAPLDQSLTPLASVTSGHRGMSVFNVARFKEETHL